MTIETACAETAAEGGGFGPRLGSGFCFPNGGIAVCDQHGRQIPELQLCWPGIWAQRAAQLGYDPNGFVFETPGGKIRIFKNRGRFGWEIL